MYDVYVPPVDAAEETENPFLVRGHHATNYWRFLVRGYTPEIMVQKSVEAAVRGNETLGDDYFADVYGSSPSEIKKSSARTRDVYQTFLELSPESPVHFVIDAKDNICNTCAIGRHCTMPSESKKDEIATSAFVVVAKGNEIEEVVAPLTIGTPLESGLRTTASATHYILGLEEYGVIFDALQRRADGKSDTLGMFLDIAGLPEYYDLVTQAADI